MFSTNSDFGMYNVTAYAWNFVTEIETKDELMVIVTSAPCSPPEVTIPINSTIGTFPLSYIRSESITVDSLAKVNCSGIVSTKGSEKQQCFPHLAYVDPSMVIVGGETLHHHLTLGGSVRHT